MTLPRAQLVGVGGLVVHADDLHDQMHAAGVGNVGGG
jgi:hypothetical protein